MVEMLAMEFLSIKKKAFHTVDHQILLAQLNDYWIRGFSNDWFKSYLSSSNQYISINGYDSSLAAIICGTPQNPFIFATSK